MIQGQHLWSAGQMHPCLLFASIVLYWEVIIYGFIQGAMAKLGASEVGQVSLRTLNTQGGGHLETDSSHCGLLVPE